jgi:hypothetical protein
MPTVGSGNITPGTGKITYPDNSSVTPGSTGGSANSGGNSSAARGQITIDVINLEAISSTGIFRDLVQISQTEVELNFKSLIAGPGISFTTDDTSITINSNVTSLPIASTSSLGVIKVGSGLSIDNTGLLSATGPGNTLAFPIKTVTANYTVSHNDYSIMVNASAGPVTITLPAAAGGTSVMNIKKIDASTNAVTIVVSGSDKVDLGTSLEMALQLQAFQIQSDGVSNWWVL